MNSLPLPLPPLPLEKILIPLASPSKNVRCLELLLALVLGAIDPPLPP